MNRTPLAIAAIVIFSMTAKQTFAAPPSADPHIQITVLVLEVSHKKLEALKIDNSIPGLSEMIKPHQVNAWIDGHILKQEGVKDVVTTLQKHEVAKVVANPTIVLVDGTRASCKIDGNHETKLDFLTTILANNSIRVELGIQTEPYDVKATDARTGKVISIKANHKDTAFELAAGQSAVLRGDTVSKADKKDPIETWFIVTAQQTTVATKQKTIEQSNR